MTDSHHHLAPASDAQLPDLATTPARQQFIETRLTQALSPVHLEIIDDSAKHAGHAGASSGGHFTVVIAAAAFAGKSRVGRHRLVYDALAEAMQRGIHALAIAAYTPEEFAARQ
ncbi:MAG: BolA family protein [Janthinobacterium lividum]